MTSATPRRTVPATIEREPARAGAAGMPARQAQVDGQASPATQAVTSAIGPIPAVVASGRRPDLDQQGCSTSVTTPNGPTSLWLHDLQRPLGGLAQRTQPVGRGRPARPGAARG